MDSQTPNACQREGSRRRFFERPDWFVFGIGTVVALGVYGASLAPHVTLDYSGIYATTALHPSGSMPPGHPIWSVYGWLCVELLPFSNVAVRLAAASALAGAVACGWVGLLVSRVSGLAITADAYPSRLSHSEETAIRVVCGVVAGLGLAFDNAVWSRAVVADPLSLSLALFAMALCLLARWLFVPEDRRYLCLAALVQGLSVAENQALIAATFAIPFLIALLRRQTAQQMFLGMSLCLLMLVLFKSRLAALGWHIGYSTGHLLFLRSYSVCCVGWSCGS